MIATASRNHHGSASARTSSVSREVDLPDQVGDREAGEEQRRRDAKRAAHACDAPERLDHVRDVVVGVGGRERQREDLVARALGDRQRRLPGEALAVPGEPVHGQEVDRGRDPLGRERALQLVPAEAETGGVDPDDVEMEGVRVARVALERLDPVEPRDPLVVERELALARGGVLRELVELHERDRSEHVGEVGLVAGDGDVVERAVAAAHQAQVPDRVRDLVRVRRDEPALAGGDVLRRVEAEAGRLGEPAELAAAVGALGRVRGVLDHRDPELPDRIQVGRLPGEVDGHDRLRPLGHRRRDGRRVDVEVALAHVDEDGRRAGVDDHVRGRRPGDRRRDHLVAGLDPERDERQVHRRRAGRDREHVLRLEVLGHPLLEQRRLRAGRQPAGAERLGDGLDLLLADRRRLEAQWCLAGHSTTKRISSAAARARSSACSRLSPTAITAPARSGPRRSGPKTCPGWR